MDWDVYNTLPAYILYSGWYLDMSGMTQMEFNTHMIISGIKSDHPELVDMGLGGINGGETLPQLATTCSYTYLVISTH